AFCREPMARRNYETPSMFMARKYCCRAHSREGTTAGLKKHWAAKREAAKPAPKPARSHIDEAEQIAKFIAEGRITICPPAFCAPSQQGSVDEREVAGKLKS